MDTIESRVADTVLQKPRTIVAGDQSFQVAPPTIATLIEVSGLISQLPEIDANAEGIMLEALRNAKHCRGLGDIAATLVCGASRHTNFPRQWLHRRRRRKMASRMLQLSPSALHSLIIEILSNMEIAPFFGLTVSLSAINMTKPKKETVTTASGQSLQE